MKAEEFKKFYEDADYFQWYGYQPLLNSFGKIVIQIEDNDYEGDSRILYKDDYKGLGFLMFGWGSCSGCDEFYGCNTFEEAEEFSNELESKIIWFKNKKEALKWFRTHDWEGDWSYNDKNTKLFRKLCIEYFMHDD